jgi:heterodisulfide reductase subunit C2
MPKVNTVFVDKLRSFEGFDASACMSCAVCTAVCPMEIEVLPRKLFRYVVLGLEDRFLEHQEAVYQCLLCKMCEENCTAGVHIADNVRVLRGYISAQVFKL